MLSPDELRRYEEDGFVVCPALVPRADCEGLCAHLSDAIARVLAETAAGTRTEPGFWALMARSRDTVEVFRDPSRPGAGEGAVMRVGHALHARDPGFAAFAAEPALRGRLRQIVGEPGWLIQSAVIYKQPRSDLVQFGLHQDAWYLTTEPESLALAFVALDDMTVENGCLEVVPGSHREGLGVVLAMGPDGFAPASGAVPRGPAKERAVPLVIERGSVAFVHGRTYHASAPNRSDGPRRALILHVMSGRSRLAPTSWIVREGEPPPLVPL